MEDNYNQNSLIITDDIKSFLKVTSKWSKILAIIGFVSLGIMVIAGVISALFLGSASMSDTNMSSITGGLGGVMAFVYIIFAIVYYFPLIYLYRFSTNIKSAVDGDDQNQLSIAFEYLKKHYKFIGILTIAIIILYAIIFFIALILGVGALM